MMAKSQWLWLEGECYCFASDGALYMNCTTHDGCKVDETGVWIQYVQQNQGLSLA